MATEDSRPAEIAHSAEDQAQHRAIRERFRGKPSLREVATSAEIDVEPYDRAARLQQAGPTAVDPETLTEIGGALRRARADARLSLAEVTLRSGIDSPALSRLENGLNPNQTLATLSRFTQALGKRIHWSLGG
jgi:hypothetical protein